MKNGIVTLIARHTGIEGGNMSLTLGTLTNLEILGDTENVLAKECKSIRLVGWVLAYSYAHCKLSA